MIIIIFVIAQNLILMQLAEALDGSTYSDLEKDIIFK